MRTAIIHCVIMSCIFYPVQCWNGQAFCVAWRLSELSAFINGASHHYAVISLTKPATSGFGWSGNSISKHAPPTSSTIFLIGSNACHILHNLLPRLFYPFRHLKNIIILLSKKPCGNLVSQTNWNTLKTERWFLLYNNQRAQVKAHNKNAHNPYEKGLWAF